MKKLTSMLMIAALTSGALALSAGQSFAKGRPVRAPHAVTVKTQRKASKARATRSHAKTRKAHRRPSRAKKAPASSMPQMG